MKFGKGDRVYIHPDAHDFPLNRGTVLAASGDARLVKCDGYAGLRRIELRHLSGQRFREAAG